MKYIIPLIIVGLLITGCGKKNSATTKKETFHVSGNCGMCKKTIEKSLNVKGVMEANWDKVTKNITVVYDTNLISLDEIKKKIAKAGYDNDGYRADDASYSELHTCCQYDREK